MIDKASVELDWQEACEYCPGTQVELKQRPGHVDVIAAYDPMMVPPIWLCNDPQPRYPEELQIVNKTEAEAWQMPTYEAMYYPACQVLLKKNVAKAYAFPM